MPGTGRPERLLVGLERVQSGAWGKRQGCHLCLAVCFVGRGHGGAQVWTPLPTHLHPEATGRDCRVEGRWPGGLQGPRQPTEGRCSFVRCPQHLGPCQALTKGSLACLLPTPGLNHHPSPGSHRQTWCP